MPPSTPFVPTDNPAQAKPVIEEVPLENPVLPGVLAVTVTVLPLALAVTVAELHRVMAAARFDASVVVLLSAANVPVVVPQAVVPFEPVEGVPHVKRVLSPVPDKVTAPNAVAVTLTSPAELVAVAPRPEQALIAS